jgi:hypothetical protein
VILHGSNNNHFVSSQAASPCSALSLPATYVSSTSTRPDNLVDDVSSSRAACAPTAMRFRATNQATAPALSLNTLACYQESATAHETKAATASECREMLSLR